METAPTFHDLESLAYEVARSWNVDQLRIVFDTRPPDSRLHWRVEGRAIASGRPVPAWQAGHWYQIGHERTFFLAFSAAIDSAPPHLRVVSPKE
jgi:hypothetical protein